MISDLPKYLCLHVKTVANIYKSVREPEQNKLIRTTL